MLTMTPPVVSSFSEPTTDGRDPLVETPLLKNIIISVPPHPAHPRRMQLNTSILAVFSPFLPKFPQRLRRWSCAVTLQRLCDKHAVSVACGLVFRVRVCFFIYVGRYFAVILIQLCDFFFFLPHPHVIWSEQHLSWMLSAPQSVPEHVMQSLWRFCTGLTSEPF